MTRLKFVYKKLIRFKTTTLVLLNDYLIPDVEQLLCSVLHLEVCPEGVASIVHQLSGGNPFWCKEMCLFIRTTGIAEFMRVMDASSLPLALEPFSSPVSAMVVIGNGGLGAETIHPFGGGAYNVTGKGTGSGFKSNVRLSIKTSTEVHKESLGKDRGSQGGKKESVSPVGGFKDSIGSGGDGRKETSRAGSPSSNIGNINDVNSEALMLARKPSEALGRRFNHIYNNNNTPRSMPNSLTTPRNTNKKFSYDTSEYTSTKAPIPINNYSSDNNSGHSTTSKIELFIVCRFEKLSSEDQNVLRTASIIGHDFSRETLYGILSPKMRTQMFNSIVSLVKNQWITDSKMNSSCEYSFVHPLLYQTLYDLTPASDKARLHYAVASYIEDANEGDPAHFSQLGHQYRLVYTDRSIHVLVYIPPLQQV